MPKQSVNIVINKTLTKMEGLILRRYIENQRKPKTQIAKELGMSKQNLYQLFDSKKLEDGTIKNIESVFKTKWTVIKASVNMDGNIAPVSDSKPRQGGQPEKQEQDLIKEVSRLNEQQITIEATLSVILSEVAPLIAKATGRSHASVFSQMKKDISTEILNLKSLMDKR